MVLLTLAAFVLEKFGGDSMAEVKANLAAYRERLAAPIPAPVPGHPHGLTGTDEAGSGGDD